MKDIDGIDEEKLNDYQRDIYKIYNELRGSFVWKDTRQGGDYWAAVCHNLIVVIKDDIAADKKAKKDEIK